MSDSNFCFLTCIQVSQEAGLVFPSLEEFSTVCCDPYKGFDIVNKAEVDIFMEFCAFSMIQWMLAIWSLVPLPFLNPVWTSGISRFMYCWSLAWRIFFNLNLFKLEANYFTILYWFCRTSTWIHHGCTQVPNSQIVFLFTSHNTKTVPPPLNIHLYHHLMMVWYISCVDKVHFYSPNLIVKIKIFPAFHHYAAILGI